MTTRTGDFVLHINSYPQKRGRWIVASVLWIGVIFFSSTTLADDLSESAFHNLASVLLRMHEKTQSFDIVHLLADKGLHVTLFCVLAWLLWQALAGVPRRPVIILCLGAAVGCCSEYLQSFFPGRDPAIRDVVINLAGTAVGVGLRARAAIGNRPADPGS